MTKYFNNSFLRYLAGGAANTAFSYLVYRLLLLVVPYEIAYSGSYIAGIVSGYFINAMFVFRAPVALKSIAKYPLAYAIPYLAGLIMMRLLVGGAGMDARYAPFVVLLFTTPLAYWLTKRLIGGSRSAVTPD